MSYRLIACVGLTAFAVSFAQGGTVAYWPMVRDPATGGTDRKITDAGGSGYALDVNLTDAQVTNTSAIAFSRPPNGPSEVTAASCVEVVNGTSLKTAPFQRGTGTQSQTSDPLFLAMGLRNDFTIEGYMYIKSLRHGNNADTGIVFSGVNGTGDWTWYLVEPTKNSNTRQVVVALRKNNNIDNGGILTTIDDNEILGGWHHYALVFKFNEDGSNSRWTFYLDGVNRGSKTMANRAADENVQHERFLFGGFTASGANKVLDAKFAFWRVSDEALSSGSLLCHQAFATTVAYWPMNVTSAFYDDAAHDIVPDAADERNTLTIRDSTYGGVSWTDSDIGWTTPPNPDAYLAAAGVSCWSKQMIKSANKKIDNKYRPVFTTAADAPVIEATKLNTSFTIEGFAKFTELPATDSENQMFVYNTLGEKGGWCWNLYGADANGNLAMKVSYVSSGGRTTVACGDNLRKEELLNVWNHYALTFTPNNGKGKTEWRFYLNGRLLGMYNDMPAYSDYEFTNPKFYIS